MLNTDVKKDDDKLVISLKGRLDTTTAPQLEEVINNSISGATQLTFNMEKLEYISSAGLRVLLSSQKIMNKQGTMIVKNVSEEVQEIFEVTGFSDIFTIQ